MSLVRIQSSRPSFPRKPLLKSRGFLFCGKPSMRKRTACRKARVFGEGIGGAPAKGASGTGCGSRGSDPLLPTNRTFLPRNRLGVLGCGACRSAARGQGCGTAGGNGSRRIFGTAGGSGPRGIFGGGVCCGPLRQAALFPRRATKKSLCPKRRTKASKEVGTCGFEPQTSCLSSRRSKPTELCSLHKKSILEGDGR